MTPGASAASITNAKGRFKSMNKITNTWLRFWPQTGPSDQACSAVRRQRLQVSLAQPNKKKTNTKLMLMIIQITKHRDSWRPELWMLLPHGTRCRGRGKEQEWYESSGAGSEMVRLFFILFWQQTNNSDLALVSGALVDKSGLSALG